MIGHFHRIMAIDTHGTIGFSFSNYTIHYIRSRNEIIGCDNENYPVKTPIEKIRRLDQFRVTASYNIEEVFDESNIES